MRVVGHDTVVVAGARVTLHRVTVTQPGPVDSLISGAGGRFAFSIPSDTGVVYLVSARWAGIDYFAQPFVTRGGGPLPPVTVLVSDTSSTTPIELVARHLIVSPVAPDGTRDVVDLFVLNNPGDVTRVSTAAKPAWRALLPRFAINVRVGNGAFAAESVHFVGEYANLDAAIPPGQRDFEIDYQVPPSSTRFEVPIDASAAISNVVSEDRGVRVVSSGFVPIDTVIEGKSYRRWQGSVAAGTPIVLAFSTAAAPNWTIPVILVAMALVLIGVTARTLHSSR